MPRFQQLEEGRLLRAYQLRPGHLLFLDRHSSSAGYLKDAGEAEGRSKSHFSTISPLRHGIQSVGGAHRQLLVRKPPSNGGLSGTNVSAVSWRWIKLDARFSQEDTENIEKSHLPIRSIKERASPRIA